MKKNNKCYIFSRKMCPDYETLQCLLEYLYRQGFIGEYALSTNFEDVFETLHITESGIAFLFGKTQVNKYSDFNGFFLQTNFTVNNSLLRIG